MTEKNSQELIDQWTKLLEDMKKGLPVPEKYMFGWKPGNHKFEWNDSNIDGDKINNDLLEEYKNSKQTKPVPKEVSKKEVKNSDAFGKHIDKCLNDVYNELYREDDDVWNECLERLLSSKLKSLLVKFYD